MPRSVPSAIGIAGDFIMMLAAIGIRREMLTAVLEPAHRMLDLRRQPAERHLFGAQQSLVAEAAADIGRDDAHIAVLEPEAFGKPGLHGMRKLCRGDRA